MVVWLYAELPARYRRARAVDRSCKGDVTFFGCDHGGAALPVGGRGFRAERSSRGLRETGAPVAADRAPGAGPGRLRWVARPQSGGSEAVGAVARRGRGIGPRAGGTRP